MVSSVVMLLGAAVAYGLFTIISGLWKNVAAAKRSGLPYYVIPFSPTWLPARLTTKLWIPLFKCLPRKYWGDIEPVLDLGWHFQQNHRAFEKPGEAFLLVTPARMILCLDNAEAIHEVTSKREAFPKPTGSYKILKLYGDNILTSEGPLWRLHRKVTSASFNERNAALVFQETIHQTKGLIGQWLGPDGQGDKTIRSLEHDSMALMLNIIGYVGFGLRLLWPGQTLSADTDPRLAKYASLDAPEGHTMSFADSLRSTLDHLLLLLLFPKWILNNFFGKLGKTAVESENNYVKYMNEFLQDKIEDVRTGNAEEGMDIMGQLVRTSYGDKSSSGSRKEASKVELPDSEIIGNAFIMIVAGHETTANIVHFALVELATNPAAQRRLQRDVDAILGGRAPEEWDYETTTNALQASMVGASVNETLRLMPPVVSIPKEVSPTQDQVLNISGEKHLLPRSTYIDVTVSAVQRNPRYWPTRPSRVDPSKESDIEDFVPERWFQTGGAGPANLQEAEVEGADTEDFGGFAGPDTSAQLYRPPRGAFIPFSDGARSCLGRRLAQVELLTALAVIFRSYSIELAVDDFVPGTDAGDEKVAAMDRKQLAGLYRKAQENSRAVMATASTRLTLKLHSKNHVPVRLVKRGEERFVSWVDEDA